MEYKQGMEVTFSDTPALRIDVGEHLLTTFCTELHRQLTIHLTAQDAKELAAKILEAVEHPV